MAYFIAFLWVAVTVFSLLFIYSGRTETKKSTLLFKMTASTAFLCCGVCCAYLSPTGFGGAYQRVMIAALALGWLGDIFLTADPFTRNKPKSVKIAVILTGGVSFFAGHFFYIYAFVTSEYFLKENIKYFVLFTVAVAALVVAAKFLLKIKLGKMAVPVALYALILSVVVGAGFTAALGVKKPIAFVTSGAGSVLFLVSDFFLGMKNFDSERFNTLPVRTVYVLTYYMGQMLLASSLAIF